MTRVTPRLPIVIASVLVIALLALQVWTDGPVTTMDTAMTEWFVAHRIDWLTQAMLFVSAAHQIKVLLPITAVLGVLLVWRGHGQDTRRLAVVPVGMLLNGVLKTFFMRPRPALDDPLVRLATLSFPSGHAVASTVFWGVLCAIAFAHWRRRSARAVALAVAACMVLLVTFSRVYLGAHYVSDVVAGVAEGIACLAILLPAAPAAHRGPTDPL